MDDFVFLSPPSAEIDAEDIERIISLYRHEGWWSEAADNRDLAERIIAGSHCFLAVKRKGTIIGMGRVISDGASDAYIQDVAVEAGHRGRGIGREIILRLVKRVEGDGLSWIGLIAERNSWPFYATLGFEKMPDAVPMLKTSS